MSQGINLEFDSRIQRVSMGVAGILRPDYTPDGQMQRAYCLHCGAPGGYVTADLPPILRHDPGVIYICPACDATMGALPAHAISFSHRKEG